MKRRNLHVDGPPRGGRVPALRAVPRGGEPVVGPAAGVDGRADGDQIRDPDARLADLIGVDKRVLVVGRRTRALCRALAAAGCRVSAAADSRTNAVGRRLPAGSFDAVALVRLIEYVDDPVGVLRRLGRLLGSDGSIVAAVPNITHGSVRLRLLAGLAPPASFEPDAPSAWRCYDAASIRQLFERAGFVITESQRCREAFDCSPEALTGTLPPALIQTLAADLDALTSAFVVVAHKSPLTTQVQLQLRVRDLARTRDADRQALDAVIRNSEEHGSAIAALESRHGALARELADLEISRRSRREQEQQQLRNAFAALTRLGAEATKFERDLKRLQYEQLIARLRGVVTRALPRGAVALVASKGDPRLVDFEGRTGWHFLQTRHGTYAGHHPADSAAAIEALKKLRAKGAGYLVFPATSLWWLDHYAGFREFLDRRFPVLVRDERTCVVYVLRRTA